MNNSSRFYSRLNDIQAEIGNNEYGIARLFIVMRELIDESEQQTIAAEAKLSEIEKQEPVAHRWLEATHGGEQTYSYEDGIPFVGDEINDPYKYERLYASPVQQSPAVATPNIDDAIAKLTCAQICHPNAIQTLIYEAIELLSTPTPPSSEQAHASDYLFNGVSAGRIQEGLELMFFVDGDEDEPNTKIRVNEYGIDCLLRSLKFFGYELAAKVEQPDSAAPNDIPSEWRVNRFDQIKVGDVISLVCGDKHICTTAKEILNAGTNREEVIYNRKKNHYFITSMVLDGTSTHKHVFIVPNPAIAENRK